MTWRASVLTLFPEMFPGPLAHSLAGRALANGLWSLQARTSATSPPTGTARWTTRPFGGGAGMVLRPDVLDAALASVCDDRPAVYLTPRGRRSPRPTPSALPPPPGVVLLCGRYEGVDQRVIEAR